MPVESTGNLYQLLREEAALRRVAMLVAREVPQRAVFEAVIAEASDLIAPARVQIARIDDGANLDETIARMAREADTDCAVGVPIVVGGTTWGALVAVSSEPGPLAAGSTTRLGDFSQLAASAIASVQAREELRALADQQGALRRVATLVAQSAEPRAVFTAVAVETRMYQATRIELITTPPEMATQRHVSRIGAFRSVMQSRDCRDQNCSTGSAKR